MSQSISLEWDGRSEHVCSCAGEGPVLLRLHNDHGFGEFHYLVHEDEDQERPTPVTQIEPTHDVVGCQLTLPRRELKPLRKLLGQWQSKNDRTQPIGVVGALLDSARTFPNADPLVFWHNY